MLNFLRKYQKVVFGAVTGSLIVSIAFFGSYGAMSQTNSEQKDCVIGKAIDGSKLSKKHLDQLKRWIVTDAFDTDSYHAGFMPNLFNSGIIKEDFTKTGLALMLADVFFDEIKEDLEKRLEKQKTFKGYQHPAAPFISSENLYSQFLPALSEKLRKVRSNEFHLTKQNLKDLFDLYHESHSFPTEYLRRFLSYQQNQYDWIAKDPELLHGDLSLFKFHSFEDWFGPKLTEILVQVIYNGAIVAKKEGYFVTHQEAKEDLLKTGFASLQKISQKEPTIDLLDQTWRQYLAQSRLSENEAVTLWQEILLFKKLLEAKGSAILVDTFSQKEFESFVSQCREITKYDIAYDFQIKNFDELLEFEVYQEAVCEKKQGEGPLGISKNLKKEEKILSEYPQLFEKNYDLEISVVSLDDLTKSISLKKIWDWELQEENFAKIKAKFSQLQGPSREEALDKTSEALRTQIDHFAACMILKEDLGFIKLKLQEKDKQKKSLKVSQDFSSTLLTGIEDTKAFTELLEKERNLEFYTQDEKNFYSVKLLSESEKVRLLTFKQAVHAKVLSKMAEKKLLAAESEFRAKNPQLALLQDGTKKTFDQIKLEIGAYVFKGVIQSLEKKVEPVLLQGLSLKERLDRLSKHRFVDLIKLAQQDIIKEKDASVFLSSDHFVYLEKTKLTAKRKEMEPWMSDEIFSLQDEGMSDLKVDPIQGVFFFETHGATYHDQEEIAEKVKERQQELVFEAKKEFFALFLKELKEKKHIALFQKTLSDEG